MTDSILFEPTSLGDIPLQNRIVMSPMTRSRAGKGDVPSALMATYYGQRAAAGMIVTEGTQPSPAGKGYLRTPGIHSDAQVAGWQDVTDAVHHGGASMVLQIMHCGRIGHPDNKAPDAETIAPSAVTAAGEMFTDNGMQAFITPRALRLDEIPLVIDEYRRATANAMAAGFDGVELHCASGYLPAQFLASNTNQRDDNYGGSLENRIRFVREVLHAIAAEAGVGRVGLRICPGHPFNDIADANPLETFSALLDNISGLGLAYLHAIKSPVPDIDVVTLARDYFRGKLVINENFNAESARGILEAGGVEAVSFGRPFIANPDLVERYREGSALSRFDTATLYTPGARGYTDYPMMG